MIELKKWNDEYVESLILNANNKKIADNLRNIFPYPYTYEDGKNYINYWQKNNDDGGQICRAIMIDGKAVGSIGAFQKEDVYCKSAEIGYWLAEAYWGQGIMSDVVKEFSNQVFLQLEIARLYAEVYEENIASRKVLEKANFILEGVLRKSIYKNGQYKNSCIYGKTI